MDALAILEFTQEEAAEEEFHAAPDPQVRVFLHRLNPLERFDDRNFVKRYRLSKESFHWLLDLIRDDLESDTRRSRALNPLEQLSISLRFYGRASFQNGHWGYVWTSTICRVVARVTAAICEKKKCISFVFQRHRKKGERLWRAFMR